MSLPRIQMRGMTPRPGHFLPFHGSSWFCKSLTCSKFSSHQSVEEHAPEAALTPRKSPNSDEECRPPIVLIDQMQFLERNTETLSKAQIPGKVLGKVPSTSFLSATPHPKPKRLPHHDVFPQLYLPLDLALIKPKGIQETENRTIKITSIHQVQVKNNASQVYGSY